MLSDLPDKNASFLFFHFASFVISKSSKYLLWRAKSTAVGHFYLSTLNKSSNLWFNIKINFNDKWNSRCIITVHCLKQSTTILPTIKYKIKKGILPLLICQVYCIFGQSAVSKVTSHSSNKDGRPRLSSFSMSSFRSSGTSQSFIETEGRTFPDYEESDTNLECIPRLPLYAQLAADKDCSWSSSVSGQ